MKKLTKKKKNEYQLSPGKKIKSLTMPIGLWFRYIYILLISTKTYGRYLCMWVIVLYIVDGWLPIWGHGTIHIWSVLVVVNIPPMNMFTEIRVSFGL